MDDNNEKNCCERKGLTCPITGCPIARLLVSTLAIFVTIFAFEWAFHGNYMMPLYEETASMWRPEEEMKELFHICIIRILVASVVISVLYCWAGKFSTCCGSHSVFAVKFGAMVGLLLGIWDFGAYSYMPIPMNMATSWLVGDIIMGIMIGIVLALLSHCCKKKRNENA